MMGSTASVLLDEDDAAARPFGMCESGTRMGLCRRIVRFFCDLPMAESGTFCGFRSQSISKSELDAPGSSFLLIQYDDRRASARRELLRPARESTSFASHR